MGGMWSIHIHQLYHIIKQECFKYKLLKHLVIISFPPVTAPLSKKRAWSWPAYLEEEKAIAAPVKLFKEVFLPHIVKNIRRIVFIVLSQTNDDCDMISVRLAASDVSSEQKQFQGGDEAGGPGPVSPVSVLCAHGCRSMCCLFINQPWFQYLYLCS